MKTHTHTHTHASRFPLELEAFESEALSAHLDAAHRFCEFCNDYFYGEPARTRISN